ncbi:hypothetical protein E3Q15_01558 [Wallemia mellicola]|nr:hypothetical protein E3Q15_01558 [Wallemia mellicola]
MNKRQLNTFEKHTPSNYKSQLSSENYNTLLTGHLPPDVALFDQGSDVTYTCRLDLLTNVRQLNTPERFSTISGDVKSSLVGTMHLNLGYRNGTINWIEKEAYYSPHYTSTILSKKLLEKYNLYLFYKPPYRATFHNSRNEELVYDVPLINGKLLFKLNVYSIYNVPKSFDWSPKFYYNPVTKNNERLFLYAQREYRWYEEILFFATWPLLLWNHLQWEFRDFYPNCPDPTVIVPTGKKYSHYQTVM